MKVFKLKGKLQKSTANSGDLQDSRSANRATLIYKQAGKEVDKAIVNAQKANAKRRKPQQDFAVVQGKQRKLAEPLHKVDNVRSALAQRLSRVDPKI